MFNDPLGDLLRTPQSAAGYDAPAANDGNGNPYYSGNVTNYTNGVAQNELRNENNFVYEAEGGLFAFDPGAAIYLAITQITNVYHKGDGTDEDPSTGSLANGVSALTAAGASVVDSKGNVIIPGGYTGGIATYNYGDGRVMAEPNRINHDQYLDANNVWQDGANQGGNVWPDPVNARMIAGLDPRLQGPATDFLNLAHYFGTDLRITQGYRSIEEQNKFYAQGRTTPGPKITNAKGGQSYHQYGLAFDVVVMQNGVPNWNVTVSPGIAWLATEIYGFEWGGNFNSIKDYPHFQMTFGQTWQQLYQQSQH
jgi:hypothetical protein